MSRPMFAARARRLSLLFRELHAIMFKEHETNWIRGVGNIIALLDEAEDDPSAAKARIEEAHQTFSSMHRGNGTFSDFYIARENFEERLEANAEFEKVSSAIWREFESTT